MAKKCLGCMNPLQEGIDACPVCGYVQATQPREAYHLVPGTILRDRYLIGKAIGYGGFGVTYIGYDTVLDSKVAIKEYFPSEFATRVPGVQTLSVYSGEAATQFESGLKSFDQEAKRLAKLSDVPGVVKIYDTFTTNKTGYIIMEYLDGETVKDKLAREGIIPYEEAVNIIVAVLSTLSAVHPSGIIHRDISPGNIFLTKSGEVKLIDFGASRYASATHTKSLSIILKPGYAPEEQYRSRGNQGTWTDVYATAATMYRMITGVTPQESIERVGKDELKDPSKLGVKITKNQENALMNALNITAETRTQTAEQFLSDLMSDADVVRNKIMQRKKDEGKWPLWLKIVAGLVPVAMIGVLLFVFLNHGAVGKNGDFTVVPNILNQTEADAQQMLEDRDLSMLVAGTVVVDFGDKGIVQDFSPTDGTYLQRFETVSVWLSLNETVFMPDVCMWDKDAAEMRIKAAGLNMHIEEVETNDYAQGIVFEQEFEKGAPLSKNTLVTVKVAVNTQVSDATTMVAVPDIVGLSKDQALEKLRLVGIFGKVTSETFDNSEEGTVLTQTNAGASVAAGTIIEISISKGREFMYMPDIALKTKDEVTRIFEDTAIRVNYTYEETNDYEEDLVLKQSVAAGTKMYDNDSVTVTLSKFAYGEVPDVTGMSKDQAISAIEAAGFKASISTEKIYSDTVAKDHIAKQAVVGTYQKGKTILINLSNGPTTKTATVPNVAGLPLVEAQKKLADAKFSYAATVQEVYSDTVPKGSVVSYSPGGTQTLGTTVTCTVSKGPEFVTVPGLTGKTLAEARKALTAIGLAEPKVSYAHSEDVPRGMIISQANNAGSEVLQNSQISLTVSKGTAGKWVTVDEIANYPVSDFTRTSQTQERYRIETVSTKSQTVASTTAPTLAGYTYTGTMNKNDNWGSWQKGTRSEQEGLVNVKKEPVSVHTGYIMHSYRSWGYRDGVAQWREYRDYKPSKTSYYASVEITVNQLPTSSKYIFNKGVDNQYIPYCSQNDGTTTAYLITSLTGGQSGAPYNSWMWFIKEKVYTTKYEDYFQLNTPTYTYYYEKVESETWSEWLDAGSNPPAVSGNQRISSMQERLIYWVVGK